MSKELRTPSDRKQALKTICRLSFENSHFLFGFAFVPVISWIVLWLLATADDPRSNTKWDWRMKNQELEIVSNDKWKISFHWPIRSSGVNLASCWAASEIKARPTCGLP